MKTYPDKFHMTPQQSLFLARKRQDENVYCGMRMENRSVTFSQTKTILQGVNVAGVQLSDIEAIFNTRDMWRFLLSSMDAPVSLEYLCKLNEFNARNEALEWGRLRTGFVGSSGTDYMPPVPSTEAVRNELTAILTADNSATAKALEAFVWGARGQFFRDGNKRASMTLANKILIAAGAGFLTITDKHMEHFNALLLTYYDTGESEAPKDFLYENTIHGIT